MDENVATARLLLDVLRDAIETNVTERAKRRLLLLLDAVDLELRPLVGMDEPQHAF